MSEPPARSSCRQRSMHHRRQGLYNLPGLVDSMHFRQQRGDDSRCSATDAAAAIRGIEKLGLYLDGITAVAIRQRQRCRAENQEAVARHIFPAPVSSGRAVDPRAAAMGTGSPDRLRPSEAARDPPASASRRTVDWLAVARKSAARRCHRRLTKEEGRRPSTRRTASSRNRRIRRPCWNEPGGHRRIEHPRRSRPRRSR